MKLSLLSLFTAALAIDRLQIGVIHKVEDCTVKARPGDQVAVHYKGTLEDGTEFDNSFNRGQPIQFKLGARQVISGWDQGINGMCIGEKRRLTIPPELGYGKAGAGGVIPPGATLIFETELVGINGKTHEEL